MGILPDRLSTVRIRASREDGDGSVAGYFQCPARTVVVRAGSVAVRIAADKDVAWSDFRHLPPALWKARPERALFGGKVVGVGSGTVDVGDLDTTIPLC